LYIYITAKCLERNAIPQTRDSRRTLPGTLPWYIYTSEAWVSCLLAWVSCLLATQSLRHETHAYIYTSEAWVSCLFDGKVPGKETPDSRLTCIYIGVSLVSEGLRCSLFAVVEVGVHTCVSIYMYIYILVYMYEGKMPESEGLHMGWLRWVGSLKWQVSFAKEPYKRYNILQKRPIILGSLLLEATP